MRLLRLKNSHRSNVVKGVLLCFPHKTSAGEAAVKLLLSAVVDNRSNVVNIYKECAILLRRFLTKKESNKTNMK